MPGNEQRCRLVPYFGNGDAEIGPAGYRGKDLRQHVGAVRSVPLTVPDQGPDQIVDLADGTLLPQLAGKRQPVRQDQNAADFPHHLDAERMHGVAQFGGLLGEIDAEYDAGHDV